MALSEDLISQFVDVTKDNDKKSKETITYGTIKEKDGKTYVLLDGATEENLTPVYTTTNVQVDERVTVMIKNHTATVTGNMSSPAARTAEVEELDAIVTNTIDTVELKADRAEIGTLIAEDAIIKNLQAENAEIKNLKADKAEIGTLIAEDATIKNLKAEKADITELNAVKADIGDLTADVGKIDTLMFGSASGDTIQTEFSNSVIAQLGDAQIKDAMIQEVSAGKITAGNIVTNHVNVMSEDGSLVIADETIQISDDNRVRVQIGKDASNDYSINIWDANGNLMFSEGGITDSAIKKAIIRNDMVSENANISAGKLNINSLFEEINGSTNTLKSSKIFFDDLGQSLEVAFKNLTTDTDGLKETVSSQGTQLTAVQGQISSKIWQQDIVETVDNVKIGGRNLILNSKGPWSTTASSPNAMTINVGQSYMNVPSGTSVIISFDIETNVISDGEPKILVYNRVGSSDGPKQIADAIYIFPSLTTGTNIKQRCVVKTTVTDRSGATKTDNYINFTDSGNKLDIYTISNLKMEIGDKATDWTPAPEDTDAAINDAKTEMTTKYSTLEQTVDGISTKVASHTTDLANKADASKVSSLEQSLNGFKTTVSNTYATKDALSAAESSFEQKADEITATVSSIQIGGRNLLPDSARELTGTPGSSAEFVRYADLAPIFDEHGLIEYTLSFDMKSANISNKDTILVYCQNNKPTNKYNLTVYSGNGTNIKVTTEYVRYSITFIPTINNSSSTKSDLCFYGTYNTGNIPFVKNVKLEKGNKPTDWTPAPEDVSSKITQTATEIRAEFEDAGKTATNYIQASANGLMVADNTKSTLGNNVFIDSDSVDIRNGETVSSSFGANIIELGKNSRDAQITFCGGDVTLKTTKDNNGYYNGVRFDTEASFRAYGKRGTYLGAGVMDDSPEHSMLSMVRDESGKDAHAILRSARYAEGSQNTWADITTQANNNGASADLAVSHYVSGKGWTQQQLIMTQDETRLNDGETGGHSGLIRPWNKVLHDSSAFQMYENQTVTLKEAISAQPTGIVLVFREIKDGSLQNNGLHTYFVPKLLVQEAPNYGHSISWAHYNGGHFVCKYLYINDTTIKGNEYNDDSGSTMSPSGITVTNNKVVLWRVYGV